MTPREMLDWYCRRGVRVTTDGVALELSADVVSDEDLSVAREHKLELINECKERDYALIVPWKSYNRVLRRFRDAEARVSVPGFEQAIFDAFESILESISSILATIDRAGYLPSRDEVLSGFAIPVEE